MKNQIQLPLIAAASLLLSGCGVVNTYMIDRSVSDFHKSAGRISIGDLKIYVLRELAQKNLPANARKSAEAFMDGADEIEIHYFRSSRVSDFKSTDDEFTPYVFRNERLVSVGWSALGGPKSIGVPTQASPRISIEVPSARSDGSIDLSKRRPTPARTTCRPSGYDNSLICD